MTLYTVETFQARYSDFAEVDEIVIQDELDYAETFVGIEIWDKLQQRAHGLLTAHFLELNGAVEQAQGKKKKTPGAITASFSVDDVSRSYDNTAANNFSNNVSKDAMSQELALTNYGRQFLALRKRLGAMVATTSRMQPPFRPW